MILHRALRFSLLAISVGVFSSCAAKNESSKFTIHIPAASTLSVDGKVSTQAFAWDKACFMLNVTAADIAVTKSATCDIETGVFAGSVAPGGDLSVVVPRGSARQVDVVAYFRNSASDLCPTKTSFMGLARDKMARVARLENVDILEATVERSATLALPTTGTTLATQYSLPAVCVASSAAPSFGTSAIVAGGGIQVSNPGPTPAMWAQSTVSGYHAQHVLTGGSLKMKLSRKTSGVE